MNTNRDQLDDAIDNVAKRLTHVDDDAVLASRVIASLPERTTWFGWLTHSWAPRLAMVAVIAVAAVLWSNRRTTEAPAATQPLAGVVPVSEPSMFAASVTRERLEPRQNQTRGTVEPLEPLEPLEPFGGLPPVESPKALAMSDVAPDALADESALSVPSLTIADLPLTAETFPQRD